MSVISVEVIKRELQKTTTKKKQQRKTNRIKENRSYSKRIRAKWFCRVFKLHFFQLIFKASLIFKSNLELAISVILKQRELYESKHVAVECRCLKIWDLLSFLICSSILVLKWRQVLSIYLELQPAQVNLYPTKDQIIRNCNFMKKNF